MRLISSVFVCLACVLSAPFLAGQAGAEPHSPGGNGQPLPSEAIPQGVDGSDWAGIRAAYEAGRHAARAVDGGHQARNPGQQFLTRFDGRGFSTQPDGGGWTWGLQLERYGFPGLECEVAGPARVSTRGERVAYDWDATVQEWFVNDARGLEHGYTVSQRPPQAREGSLLFTLAVRGELSARIQADGQGVSFVNDDGSTVLSYAGLKVIDADGRLLPSRIDARADGLVISVDERGARYPVTIDPIVQQAYLKASNAFQGDKFGVSVAISGNTVVVGAEDEDSGATGVNGNQGDNSAPSSGAVYVFVRSGASWTQQAYLKASNTTSGDRFGAAVALSGDTLVVGAPLPD